MALFFDAEWFDARLAERELSREALGAVARMNGTEIAEVFKDQRELTADHVTAFAEMLGVTAREVAERAGVSTPVPGTSAEARIAELERRVSALEAELARRKP